MSRRTDERRPLEVLVPLIKEKLEAGDKAGLEHYRRADELLKEAKRHMSYGEWGAWIRRNFGLKARDPRVAPETRGEPPRGNIADAAEREEEICHCELCDLGDVEAIRFGFGPEETGR